MGGQRQNGEALNQQDRMGETWTNALPLGARVDDRIVEIVRGGVQGKSPLRHLLGDTFVFLCFMQNTDEAQELLAQFKKLDMGIPAKLYPILSKTPTEYFGDDILIADGNAKLKALLDGAAGTTYVIRPDMHVVARRRKSEPGAWGELLRKICQ